LLLIYWDYLWRWQSLVHKSLFAISPVVNSTRCVLVRFDLFALAKKQHILYTQAENRLAAAQEGLQWAASKIEGLAKIVYFFSHSTKRVVCV